MSKVVILIVLVAVFGGGGFFLFQKFSYIPPFRPTTTPPLIPQVTKTPLATSTPTMVSDPCEVLTKGNVDVPPLYKESITWQEPRMSEREVSEFEDLSTGEGFSSTKKTGCLIKAIVSLDSANNTRDFYIENLSKNGWKLVDSADGPSGFLITYKKGETYFLLNRLNDQLELFYTQ